MLKLLKFLKKSTAAIILVILLLILQAYTDLSLPTYTSEIVNIGIMRNGIATSVPEVLRKTELDRLTIFMTQEEKDIALPHFTLMSKEDYSGKQWSDYEKKYPLLQSEELYLFDGVDTELVADSLALPSTIVYLLEGTEETSVQIQQQILANLPDALKQGSSDIFAILSLLPAENQATFSDTLREKFSAMSDTMLVSSASAYIKAEYQAIGVDVDQMQINYIIVVGLKMLGFALLGMIASILVTLIASRVAARMGRDLRSNVFRKVVSFSHKEMDQFSTASLITRSTNDIQQVQMLIVMLIRIVIYSPILALGGIYKVLQTDTSMSWVLAIGVGALFLLIGTLFVIAMPKFKIMQKLVDRINLVTREILTGLPVIRAFSTVDHEEKRFDKANMDLAKNSLFVTRVMTFMMPMLMIIMNLISLLILWVGAHSIEDGTLQVGDMMAFIQYTMQIIMSFLMLTMISIMLPRATVAANRIDEVLSTDISILDPENPVAASSSRKGILEFRNVCFRYPGADEDVLSDISFIAKPGETTAVIGSTGSGKSTLINLIPRFYDATAGSILLDGADITKLSQKDLRDRIGLVPQKGVLFSGTIESNIKFSNSGLDDMLMKKAARIAQAEEFIDNKPEGYGAPISEGGTNVSGGQKQRLSIARAIAKDPEVYIFDDSFSALDYKTDAALRKTLKEELSDSTLLIVAQRISTIMNAEQILVLDDGKIVGKGTHRELLRDCEVYQQIASSQLSKEELEQ
ncbi:MAG TPA: ABC transporter ATP-binding protein [Clostridiales bacterium]|nr:ABC transporter ATP-binding protein [Clostridiales bacterium]